MIRGGPPMPLGDIARAARGALGAVAHAEPLAVRLCSECGVEPVGLRPGPCRSCQQTEAQIARGAELADRLLIPPRFRWARFGLAPFAPPTLGRPVVHPEALRLVENFRGSLLVLRGDTDSGKTSVACAKLAAEGEHGSAVFIRCEEIAPDAPDQERAQVLLRRASEERTVLLDDLGQDLSGAPEGGGLASYRGARARRLFRRLHDEIGIGTSRRLLIVTMGITDAKLDASYGDDVARRLLRDSPGTLVLRLGGSI